jgi:hypothetical protein
LNKQTLSSITRVQTLGLAGEYPLTGGHVKAGAAHTRLTRVAELVPCPHGYMRTGWPHMKLAHIFKRLSNLKALFDEQKQAHRIACVSSVTPDAVVKSQSFNGSSIDSKHASIAAGKFDLKKFIQNPRISHSSRWWPHFCSHSSCVA